MGLLNVYGSSPAGRVRKFIHCNSLQQNKSPARDVGLPFVPKTCAEFASGQLISLNRIADTGSIAKILKRASDRVPAQNPKGLSHLLQDANPLILLAFWAIRISSRANRP